MKHIAIFNNSGDVQTALNEETIVNPYVALVSGALDYNSIQPYEPSYIGVWSDDGEGTYTFQILDAESFSLGTVKIATSELYFNGDLTNMQFWLTSYENDGWEWQMIINPVEGDASERPEHMFYGAETWHITELVTDTASSDGIQVVYDGVDSFIFSSRAAGAPLSLNTINPGYPDESE